MNVRRIYIPVINHVVNNHPASNGGFQFGSFSSFSITTHTSGNSNCYFANSSSKSCARFASSGVYTKPVSRISPICQIIS